MRANDFVPCYKQRRRWGPSTFVNIFQLIRNYEEAVHKNAYITRFYIYYHILLLTLSTVSIATVLMVLWEALELGMDGLINSHSCAVIIFLPVLIFILVCFKFSSGTFTNCKFDYPIILI